MPGQMGRKNTHPQEGARQRAASWGCFRLERAVRDANFLPFLGQGKLSPRNGRLFMPIDLDAGTAGRSGEGVWPRSPPDTARDAPCAIPASSGSPCEDGSWRTRRLGGRLCWAWGGRTRDTAGRRRSRVRASLWMETLKPEAMESMTGCRAGCLLRFERAVRAILS